jgi:hypothetical protein
MRPLPALLLVLAACGSAGSIDLDAGDEPIDRVRSASRITATFGGQAVESLVLSTVDDWCGTAAEALPVLRAAGLAWSDATTDPEADADALCAANTAYLDALRPYADTWYAPGTTTATTIVLGALAEGTLELDDAAPFQTTVMRYVTDPFAAADDAGCDDPQAVFGAFAAAVETWSVDAGTLTVEALDEDAAQFRVEGTTDAGEPITVEGRATTCDLDPSLLSSG